MALTARERWQKRYADPATRAHIRQLQKAWRARNLEHVRAQEVQRQKRYSESEKFDRTKYEARLQLRHAVKAGRIDKPERCERCGKAENLQGHHDDHSKPLDVAWLCGDCHRATHKNRVSRAERSH